MKLAWVLSLFKIDSINFRLWVNFSIQLFFKPIWILTWHALNVVQAESTLWLVNYNTNYTCKGLDLTLLITCFHFLQQLNKGMLNVMVDSFKGWGKKKTPFPVFQTCTRLYSSQLFSYHSLISHLNAPYPPWLGLLPHW